MLFRSFDLTDPLNPIPLVFLRVAGSEFTPLTGVVGTFGTPCVGQVFDFSIPDIVATIPGADPRET